jgi:hypothetical protein
MERLDIPQSAAIDLVADDKTQLRAYWMPARDPTNAPTILYLHVSVAIISGFGREMEEKLNGD